MNDANCSLGTNINAYSVMSTHSIKEILLFILLQYVITSIAYLAIENLEHIIFLIKERVGIGCKEKK